MEGPQKEKGYTPIAHKLIEAAARFKFNGTQLRIILIVWRYTYGFNRKIHSMSISFIAKAIDVNSGQVERELKTLIDNNIIHAVSSGEKTTRQLSVNKHYQTWNYPLIRGKPATNHSTLELGGSLPSKKGEDLPSNKGDKKERKKTLKKVLDISETEVIEIEKIKFLDTVYLTQAEHDRLINEFGKETVELYIEKLDEWQTNYPKKKKVDHNKTIRVWIKNDRQRNKTYLSVQTKQQKNEQQMDVLAQFYKEGAANEANGDGSISSGRQNSLPQLRDN